MKPISYFCAVSDKDCKDCDFEGCGCKCHSGTYKVKDLLTKHTEWEKIARLPDNLPAEDAIVKATLGLNVLVGRYRSPRYPSTRASILITEGGKVTPRMVDLQIWSVTEYDEREWFK